MPRTAGAAAEAIQLRRPALVAPPSWTRRFYVAITLVLIVMVLRGFWPTYFGPLLSGGVTRPWIIHVHAAVLSGWMALLLGQLLLVASGRTRLHRRIGSLGIAYGGLVLGVGLLVTFAAPVLHVRAGAWSLDEAAGFLLLPLVDMVLFGGFFGAAVAYRGRPEIHKRLILAATVALALRSGRPNLRLAVGLRRRVVVAPLRDHGL